MGLTANQKLNVGKFEDVPYETTENKAVFPQSISGLCEQRKQPNVCAAGVFKGGEKRGQENVSEELRATNFPGLIKTIILKSKLQQGTS